MNTTSKNPYVGPRTFQKNEGHLFYGRDREARDLTALVASERLVIFYAQSGAGKSSIVNTRLIPGLEDKEYEVLPVGRVGGDAPEGIDIKNIYIYNLLRSLEQHETDSAVVANLSLSDFLAQLNTDEKGFFYDPSLVNMIMEGDDVEIVRRALVIDQFEELFSTHPEAWEKRDEFFKQLAQAMQTDPGLWVVLVMREDYIASLDPYAHYVENGLRVRYYMQRLERDAALKAVTSPVEKIRPFAPGVAEKLIDDLCSITVQKPDGELDIQPGQYVEPVQLQVVCYELWENLPPKGKEITLENLQNVGDVGQSLGKYYDRRVGEVAKAKKVRERIIREWFEKKLITADGIRNMVLQERETKPGELADDVVQALQSDLVRAEKRGGATWYELTHDRLVDPILKRNEIWFNENLSPLQRQAALWKDQDQNENWLLRDQALADIEAWANENQDELTDTEKEFLTACQKAQAQIEERQAAERQQLEMANKLAAEQARSAKRAKLFNIVSGALIVVAIIATLYAFDRKKDADQNAEAAARAEQDARRAEQDAKLQSDIARAGELSTVALEQSNSQLDLAILLGVQANSFHSNSQTRKAMLTLLQKSSRYKGTINTEADIQQIQYSPDGRIFASRDENGITFWDAKDIQKPLNDTPVNWHFSSVTAFAMSQDGNLIASGAIDGTIVIWDAVSRQMLSMPFKTNNNTISNLAFSPDNKNLVSTNWGSPGDITLWDITDLAKPLQITTLHPEDYTGSVIDLAISPDGNTLATGNENYSITLWDLEKREVIGEPLKDHSEPVYGVVFSPDGKTLAAGSYDDTVILWDVSDLVRPVAIGEPLAEHEVDIETIAISPDGNTIASGDDWGNIILWDVSDPDNFHSIGEPLNGNTSWIVSLAFSPDGNTLAAGSAHDGTIILWDIKKRTQIGQTLRAHNAWVGGVAFNPDGNILVSASQDSTIIFWDVSRLNSPEKIGAPLQGHPGQPTGMAFSPDSSLLASYGDDGTILLDVKKQKQIGVGDILTSPDESILAYQTLDKATGERAILLMDAEANEFIGDPLPGQNPFFSPDGQTLVYETTDQATGKTVFNIWDIVEGKNIGKDIDGSNPFFSSDGQVLVYETTVPDSDLYYINLWDITKAQNISGEIQGSYRDISSDNQFLVYQTYDPDVEKNFINLWDVTKAQKIGEAIEGEYMAFGADNQIFIYQTYDPNTGQNFIKFWDIATAKGTGKSIEGSYTTISSDGKTLVYQTYDVDTGNNMINLMDTATGSLVTEPIVGNAWVWSANGNVLLYNSYDEKGRQFTGALNTATGAEIVSPVYDFYFNNYIESGQILAYEIYDYESGKYKIILIDTVIALDQGQINGSGLNLTKDGKYLIYGPEDGSGSSVNLWDVTKRYLVAGPLTGTYKDMVNDNKILVYESIDRNVVYVNLFDVTRTLKIGEPIKGTFLGISPDGETLATRNENNAVVFWDVTRTWPFGEPITEIKDKVSSAALSPDGNMLAFAGAKGITLEDVSMDKVLTSLSNDHFGAVDKVNISQDGNFLISFGEDGNVIAWDLDIFQPLSDPITGTQAYFSPNEKYMAVIDYGENVSIVWDLIDQRAVAEPFIGSSVTFSPDEKYAAVGDGIENTIVLWDLTKWEAISEPFSGQSVTFSPDAKILAISNEIDHSVTLWDITTRKAIDIPLAGQDAVFSPDGSILALVDRDNNTTILWNLAAGAVIGAPLTGQDVIFTQDDQTLAISLFDINLYTYTTTLLDMATGQVLGDPFQGSILSTPDTNDILALVDRAENTTTFWDPETQERTGTPINGTDAYVTGTKINFLHVYNNENGTTSLWNPVTHKQIGETFTGYYSFSSNAEGTLMLIVDYINNTTVIWDLEADKQVGNTIDGYYDSLTLCDDVDSKVMVWIDPETTTVHFWDLEKDQSLGEFKPSEDSYGVGLTFNATCDMMALTDWNQNTTILWDLTNNQSIGNPIEGSNVLFSSNGFSVAIGNQNSATTRFWNLATAEQVGEDVPGADFSTNPQNSDILSVGSYDPNTGYNQYVLWDLKSLTQIGETPNGYPTFMPDGTLIVYGSKGVAFWNVDGATPEMVGQLGGHSSPIRSMLLSQNGDVLASLASDGIVLTNIDSGASLHLETVDYSGQLTEQMAFDPDGESFTALGSDGTIFIWNITSESAAVKAPRQINAPYTSAYRSALSPDGKYLVYEDGDQNFYVWDIAEGEALVDPTKIETCCGGAITFTTDGNSMFYNNGGSIVKWEKWYDPANSAKTERSFGQDAFTSLNIVMDPADPSNPKYILATFVDQSGKTNTQIWDWEKNSKVGDPISGNIQVYGSNVQTHVLIYMDNDGRLIKFDLNPTTWQNLLCERAGRNFTREEWDLFRPEGMEYRATCPD